MSFLMLLQIPLKFWQMCKNSLAKISGTPKFFIRCVNNTRGMWNRLWSRTLRLTGRQAWCDIINKSSLPIGLAELWESEPIGTCKNNNPIHDQGCGYNYLDDRPSKWGFPLTLTKTTWIFNFYCTAVFLKAIQLPWTRWFQKCITLGCQIPRSSF